MSMLAAGALAAASANFVRTASAAVPRTIKIGYISPLTGPLALFGEVQCVSTDVPWQASFFGRKGEPEKGSNFTYHFFWSLEDVTSVYTSMWNSVKTNDSVGALFSNDSDGHAWRTGKLGFSRILAIKGFTLSDPGSFEPTTHGLLRADLNVQEE